MSVKTSVSLTDKNATRIERLCELGFFNDRTDAINDAIRCGLPSVEKECGIGQ